MAVSPTKKTSLISIRELPKVVETAVKSAHARLGTTPDRAPLIKKWEIYGRRMKDKVQAEKFASAVAAEVNRTGIGADPAVLFIDDDILCGFIERGNIPVERIF